MLHEITIDNGPLDVDAGCDVQRCALGWRPSHLLALAYRQLGIAVQPVHPLVIDTEEVSSQQVMHMPVAEAPARVSDLDYPGLQRLGLDVGYRWMPVAVTAQPHKPASSPLGQPMLVDQLPDGDPLGLWG